MKNSEKEKVRNHKKNNNFKKAFKACQNGLKASSKKGSTFFLYQESRIRHFHKTIDNYIENN